MTISSASRQQLGARLVVASVSGGKDSTALALTLMENEISHVRVFADTGFEAPETYEYLDLLRSRLGPISVVRNELLWREALPGEEGMLTLIRRKKMFPSRLMRFCTQQLKIFPIRDYLRALQDHGDDIVSAVGVRAEESAARAQMAEWEFWDEMDAEIWRPLLRWTEQDVIDMHRRHDVPPNPLYLQGSRRVGCSPCIHARKQDIRLIPATQLAKIRRVEDELTADAVARERERPTRAFFQLRGPEGLRFTPIDDVVRWAHLHRGQPIEAPQEPAGCVRWGLCEASTPDDTPTLQLPDSSDIPTAPPIPTPSRPRWIGRDHLEALGFSAELVHTWLSSGVLTSPTGEGFYLRTSEFDEHFERLTARRTIGRSHLLDLGATSSTIARWLRHGALRRTADRGFYEITIAAFESLRPMPTIAAPKDESASASTIQAPERETPTPPPGPEAAPLKLRVVPCTITRARAFVAEHHRHLPPPVSGLFAVGVARGDELVGVAIVGRPVARELQDGRTAEVTRVCTRGERNACSKLLSACRRGALALGFHRLITYTLSSEPGSSLRAVGWREVAQVRGRSWNSPSRPRVPGEVRDKRRWEAPPLVITRPPTHGEPCHGEECHVVA